MQSASSKLAKLNSYDPREYYVKDCYVDVLDAYSTWRIGKILEIKDNIATVNMDGWSHKWNEVILLRFN